jgi:hypothetical protein
MADTCRGSLDSKSSAACAQEAEAWLDALHATPDIAQRASGNVDGSAEEEPFQIPLELLEGENEEEPDQAEEDAGPWEEVNHRKVRPSRP